jgi:hypothetical protein
MLLETGDPLMKSVVSNRTEEVLKRLKSFGTIQAAFMVFCSGSLSCARYSCSPFG